MQGVFFMKQKSHFICFSLKRNIFPILFCLFTVCLVLFSRQNLVATKEGLLLWANAVVPSLLPFFIATELLGHTKVVSGLGKLLNKVMRPIFNVPGEGSYAFIMGIISGYPIGAKIVTDFRNKGICTKAEGERLLAFTNNSGPLFIIGTVGISLFYDTRTGILLFVTHFLACLLVAILFRFWKYRDSERVSATQTVDSTSSLVSFSNLGEVLSSSILNAIHTVVLIGGFVVLFSVILSILEHSGILTLISSSCIPILNFFHIPTEFTTAFLSGILELTNGVKQVSSILTKSISDNVVVASFLLGFGGISVLLQVLSITSKSDLSIKPYFLGKLLQGTIASVLTYCCLHLLPFFNLDLEPVFSANSLERSSVVASYANISQLILLGLIVLVTFSLFLLRSKTKKSLS